MKTVERASDLTLLAALHNEVLHEAEGGELVELAHTVVQLSHKTTPEAEKELGELLEGLDPATAARLTHTVTVHLHLANLVDERQRARDLRLGRTDHLAAGEIASVIPAITEAGDFAAKILERMRLQPVFTAHPTEARRRAVSGALKRIAQQLDRYDDPRCGHRQKEVAKRRIVENIDILQRTSTLRQTRPEPRDEVKTTLTVFQQTLYRAVPRLYREVEAGLRALPGHEDAKVPPFVRFGTWVGGDRDGNPHVTAAVTRQTVATQAEYALKQLGAHVHNVARALTMSATTTPPSHALVAALAQDAVAIPDRFAEIAKNSPNEPHRQKMMIIGERVHATAAEKAGLAYSDPSEMLADLELVQRSLRAAGDHRSADGELQHLVWMVQTFGFHLAELEVRQHSAVHEATLIDVLQQLAAEDVEVAGFRIENPEQLVNDIAFLDAVAQCGWPRLVTPTTEKGRDVLDTLRVMAWLQQRWGKDSCGRYIVSFTQKPAHMVAVRALAALAVPDGRLDLDVVPLFETGEDLAESVNTLNTWLTAMTTMDWLNDRNRRVEVMLGYSDSAKDVGPAAATLTLNDAQQRLVRWAQDHEIDMTLFHGRGGSLGRGGGPLHRAIVAQPTGSVAGRFKVTEQGEVIFARYGDVTIAQQHLEQITAAMLVADHPDRADQRDRAEEQFKDVAETVRHASKESYRALTAMADLPHVLTTASALDEIGDLQLGSRPSRRSGKEKSRSLDDLRAIPWVFSWSMTRANVPGWFGIGTGLAAVGDIDQLREAYARWPLFAALIDTAEMSLSKTHEGLAADFLNLGGSPEVTNYILDEMRLSKEWVLKVLDKENLLDGRDMLQSAIRVRAPYVDALSRVQCRALRVLRSDDTNVTDQERLAWRHVLLLTVNGAAAGLQNTG